VAKASLGEGKVFMTGPEVTFRGKPHGTFKLLFNSLYLRHGAVMPARIAAGSPRHVWKFPGHGPKHPHGHAETRGGSNIDPHGNSARGCAKADAANSAISYRWLAGVSASQHAVLQETGSLSVDRVKTSGVLPR